MASNFYKSVLALKHGYSIISSYTCVSRQVLSFWTLDQIHTTHSSVSFFRRAAVPLTTQTRQIKKRSRSSDSGIGKLTLFPKTTSQSRLRTRRAKHKEGMDMISKEQISLHSVADYFDDIDLSRDDYEELADAISTYGGERLSGKKANDNYWKDALSFQRFIRAKTLERKYFKPQKKLNLLTWAGKEQIRFLHQQDPEEWTVESLSKVFPVGKESINKIIKSKLKLRTLQDVIQNDLHVKKNWEKILFHLRNNQLDCDDMVKDFFEDLDSINTIHNAMPSPDLPTPRMRENERIEGLFSVIVRDELDKKEEENEKLIAKHKQLSGMLSETLLEVKSILTDEKESENKKFRCSQNYSLQNSKESLRSVIKSKFLEIHDVGMEKNYSAVNSVDTDRISHSLSDRKEHKLCSYQVDDCVYDENGEFLYRVP